MSKKVLIQQQQPNPPNGPYFGRVSDPVEFMNMQAFAHEHTEGIVQDFLMPGAVGPLVGSGFDHALPGALGVSVAAGRAVKTDGKSYDTLPLGQAAVVILAAADPALPRVDLVYALLETDAAAAPVFKPFVQLRTQAQLEAGVVAYPPSQLSVPPEQYNRATIQVRTGAPNANPVAPAAGANEVPLYAVRVNAGAVVLNAGNVTDVRSRARSLFNAWAGIDGLNQSPAILNLNEAIDDRVAALLADSTYFTKTYDDPGGLLTLDADLAAFDGRYVNAAGDTMTGGLVVMPPFSAALNAIEGNNSAQANGAVCAGGSFVARNVGTPVWCEYVGARGHATTNGLGVANSFFAGVYGSTDGTGGGGGNAFHAGYFQGNLTCTGAFSKASGTFHIDHPLDPLNKDLIHGFVESSKYLLIYKIVAQLVAGQAEIDLDTALGFSPGTFNALCQEAEVTSVRSKDGSVATASDVIASEVNAGVQVFAAAPDGTEVVIVIMAERKDPFIMDTEFVDAGGRLVPEQIKQVATPELMELLLPVTMPVASGHPLEGETVTEIVPALVGKQGFARQPEVIVAANVPTRAVTYSSVQIAGPAYPVTGADDASVGTHAWTSPGNITAGGAGAAFVTGMDVGATTHYLMGTGCVLNVPSDATINGVEVAIKRRDTDGTEQLIDNAVKLVKGGVVSGNNKANTLTAWPASYAVRLYGGPTDLWGLALTAADVNAANFGAVLAVDSPTDFGTPAVDEMQITVYFTPAE